MAEDPVIDAVAEVTWMVRGVWVTMSIRAGCVLGLFDLLVESRSLAELADETGSDPGALRRVLHALEELGLVEGQAGDRFRDTAGGLVLTSGHPSGLSTQVLMQSWLPKVASWASLADAVRTGGSVYESVNGAALWDHLSAHPEEEAQFNRSMARRSEGQIAAITAGLDLSGAETVVDVGGGRGAMLTGVLRAWPQLNGVIADRPDVAAEADTAFAESGLAGRARGVASDFFRSVPGEADVYFLSNVLHDWDDADCRRILRTVRSAMAPTSRLVIVERVLGAPGRTAAEARDLTFVDLHMLVLFGARERTKAEYDDLLLSAGLRPGVLAEPALSWNLIVTSPAEPTE